MSENDAVSPDALPDHWVNRAPEIIQPYLRLMRLDRPIGIWLLALPCFWSSALASISDRHALPDIWHLLLFAVGAIVMRGAGCVWNDLVDKDIDSKVARTSVRPLAAGLISTREAALFMVTLALVGCVILLQFNRLTVWLGIASLAPIALYPFVKRVSHFPQVMLGLTFSWGALMGWSAYFGSLGVAPLLLYAATIFWTIGYDTIYAMQDVDDDALIGIGSTAIYFVKHAKAFTAMCYLLALLIAGAALNVASAGIAAFAGILVFAILLGKQIMTLDENDPASALAAFRANKIAGLALFAALVLDGLIRFSGFSSAQ